MTLDWYLSYLHACGDPETCPYGLSVARKVP